MTEGLNSLKAISFKYARINISLYLMGKALQPFNPSKNTAATFLSSLLFGGAHGLETPPQANVKEPRAVRGELCLQLDTKGKGKTGNFRQITAFQCFDNYAYRNHSGQKSQFCNFLSLFRVIYTGLFGFENDWLYRVMGVLIPKMPLQKPEGFLA